MGYLGTWGLGICVNIAQSAMSLAIRGYSLRSLVNFSHGYAYIISAYSYSRNNIRTLVRGAEIALLVFIRPSMKKFGIGDLGYLCSVVLVNWCPFEAIMIDDDCIGILSSSRL